MIEDAAMARAELEFIKRVMRQAVMTHGGELKVDPAMADQAKSDTRPLEYGGGAVRLVESKKGSKFVADLLEKCGTLHSAHAETCAAIQNGYVPAFCNCAGGDYVASRRGPRQLGTYDG